MSPGLETEGGDRGSLFWILAFCLSYELQHVHQGFTISPEFVECLGRILFHFSCGLQFQFKSKDVTMHTLANVRAFVIIIT